MVVVATWNPANINGGQIYTARRKPVPLFKVHEIQVATTTMDILHSADRRCLTVLSVSTRSCTFLAHMMDVAAHRGLP